MMGITTRPSMVLKVSKLQNQIAKTRQQQESKTDWHRATTEGCIALTKSIAYTPSLDGPLNHTRPLRLTLNLSLPGT